MSKRMLAQGQARSDCGGKMQENYARRYRRPPTPTRRMMAKEVVGEAEKVAKWSTLLLNWEVYQVDCWGRAALP